MYEQTLKQLVEEERLWNLMEKAFGTIYSVSGYYHHDETYVVRIDIKW